MGLVEGDAGDDPFDIEAAVVDADGSVGPCHLEMELVVPQPAPPVSGRAVVQSRAPDELLATGRVLPDVEENVETVALMNVPGSVDAKLGHSAPSTSRMSGDDVRKAAEVALGNLVLLIQLPAVVDRRDGASACLVVVKEEEPAVGRDVSPVAEAVLGDLVLLVQLPALVDRRDCSRAVLAVVEEEEPTIGDDMRPVAERAGLDLVLL